MQEHWHKKSHIIWQPRRARYHLATPNLKDRMKSYIDLFHVLFHHLLFQLLFSLRFI